jgi:AcrR family transcriptional regulator
VSSESTKDRIFDAAQLLIVVRGAAAATITMAEIARKAKISRQALYLHFADRAELLDALVARVNERRDLAGEIQKIVDAPSGREAIRRLVRLQAAQNPGIWPVALAFEVIRRTDRAAQRSWQHRQTKRVSACRAIVDRLRRERDLRADLSVDAATDLLYVMTSLRTWEDLVVGQGWTADNYEERVTRLLTEALTISGRRALSIGRRSKPAEPAAKSAPR